MLPNCDPILQSVTDRAGDAKFCSTMLLTATGVAVIATGRVTRISPELASREVILSAGAVGSPHLLMLSGHRPVAAN